MKSIKRPSGFGTEMPPVREHVLIYFMQKGLAEKDADFFFHQQNYAQWKTVNGKPVRNWKAVACEWIWEFRQARKGKIRLTNFQTESLKIIARGR